MMKEIDHCHIMRFYELYEGENHIYCLVELLMGGSLMERVKKAKRFPETQALIICKQIIDALEYLEAKSIIHRDIKPENIIFKSKFFGSGIALVDLGFATRKSEYDKLFSRCGTPGFVAPEVFMGKQYDCNADIFSAGVIFYIMLIGCMPFKGTYNEIIAQNLACKLDFDFSKQSLTFKPSSNRCLISHRSPQVYVAKGRLQTTIC
jgi:calcium-dependent protein kinase